MRIPQGLLSFYEKLEPLHHLENDLLKKAKQEMAPSWREAIIFFKPKETKEIKKKKDVII